MNEKSHATTVSVALSLYRGVTVGERPDAEELAALYENHLSSDRRAEVMSYIANDESVYAQWLMLFEYADEFGVEEQVAVPVIRSAGETRTGPQEQRTSLSDRLGRFFNIYTLFPGTALAGLAVFLMFFHVSQPTGLDQLYQQYGTSVSGRLELPTRSLGNFWTDPEPERFFLSQGFRAGLDRLNVDAPELELLADEAEQPAAGTSGEDEEQTLKAVGEWAALSRVQCPGQNEDFFVAADQVWVTLQARLDTIDTPYAVALAGSTQKIRASESGAPGRVCSVASVITSDVLR